MAKEKADELIHGLMPVKIYTGEVGEFFPSWKSLTRDLDACPRNG
jgi:hypothetical protein